MFNELTDRDLALFYTFSYKVSRVVCYSVLKYYVMVLKLYVRLLPSGSKMRLYPKYCPLLLPLNTPLNLLTFN